MTHNLDLILTLSGGLVAALVLGFAAHRVGLSPIVGYLLAGVAIGPFTPGFVAHHGLAEQLAEVGVILLLFGVGLHFHLADLLAVRRVAVPGALVQITAATALGAVVALSFGWSASAGVVYGLALSVASTVVLMRVLSDYGEQHTASGHIAIGWLVVEDIFTVLVLVLLPAFVPGAGGAGPSLAAVAGALGLALLKLGGLVAVAAVLGQRAIPALLGYVARTRSRELFTLTVLALALGIAVASAKLFGASMALGAFVAGMIVGQSPFAARAAAEALPMRDAFAVLFFVSVGMLFNPQTVVRDGPLIVATLGVVLLGKPLAAMAVVVLLRYPVKVALTVAVALAQVGEFSFILAALGRQLNFLPEAASSALVAASMVSITINPPLYGAVQRFARYLARRQAAAEAVTEPPAVAAPGEPAQVVVVGYGPVGQVLVSTLRSEGLQPVVIELNHDTVQRLTAAGVPAVYGDVAQREVLERAGVAHARSLIFTADGVLDPVALAHARDLNPALQVMARARYVAEVPALQAAGAGVVVAGEVEVAWAMAEHLLSSLGASPEQLDREHDRVRAATFEAAGAQ